MLSNALNASQPAPHRLCPPPGPTVVRGHPVSIEIVRDGAHGETSSGISFTSTELRGKPVGVV